MTFELSASEQQACFNT